ncbi:MAG: PD40 domain-containing protein [Deltaproteobacteria bacterium]|jgi:hypothetical protein|nr:PD40 domain-containing protein [Deltaproteobacteria bacterium]MBW2534001.1 PD40 domain-containing protein [Deltaproteobacteria bacterium]
MATRDARHHRARGALFAAALMVIVGLVASAAGCDSSRGRPGQPTASRAAPEAPAALSILYPPDGAVFPREVPAPTLRWRDEAQDVQSWRVTLQLPGAGSLVAGTTTTRKLQLSTAAWRRTVAAAEAGHPRITIEGLSRLGAPRSRGSVAIGVSRDPVGAPIFYRDVPLPFARAKKNLHEIRWRIGRVDADREPRVVLEGMSSCANCHSFARDGSVFGMNVSFGDKVGSYTVSPLQRDLRIDDETIIRWADLHGSDPSYRTAAFLNAISPDGRYVVAGAQDRSMVFTVDDIEFSFVFFFTFQGILAVYDTKTKRFWPLPGADDPTLVQTNPTFSPDGEYLVFARSKALTIPEAEEQNAVMFREREVIERAIAKAGGVRYDLYRLPFNDGRGGTAEPIEGASHNSMSNYFPKISPDGRWLVFTRAKQFNLLQPDSRLFIVPTEGGTPRPMRCNTSKFNSWHSFSPNGRWLVFSSKAYGPYTQLLLAHIDERGHSSPAIHLERFTGPERAANIPEFANIEAGMLERIVANIPARPTVAP